MCKLNESGSGYMLTLCLSKIMSPICLQKVPKMGPRGTHLSFKVDRGRPPNPIYFKGRSTFKEAAKTHVWPYNGPIWVPRPPDKCTGGETGPRKRFPLVPRPCGAKKGPKLLNFKNSPPIHF